MIAPVFTPERAAWIRANAWPTWMRAMDADYGGRGCFLFRMCACELGACVSCRDGEHDKCLTRQHGGRPLGWDMAVWAWTSGRLPVHGRSLAAVTVAGRSCRWTCPCRHAEPAEPADTAAAAAPPLPDRARLEPARTNHPTGPAPTQDALFTIGTTP